MAIEDIKNIKVQRWGWWVFFGILLMLIGLVLLSTPVLTTLASVLVFGYFLIAAGIIHIIVGIFDRRDNHFWLHLAVAIFAIIIGLLVLFNPAITLVTITLLIAAFFLTTGIFKIVAALVSRFSGRWWYLLNGLVSVLLAILILMHWPTASLWVIGLFIGIDFIFAGLSLLMIGLFTKRSALLA